MPIAGISPPATGAPGLRGILTELVRREYVQWPPPVNWCNFVNGIYGESMLHRLGVIALCVAQMILSLAIGLRQFTRSSWLLDG